MPYGRAMKFILNLIISGLALYLTTQIVPGLTFAPGTSWVQIGLAAIVLGLVNALIRPILGLLSLPITVLTFGLFALVLNGLMIWLTAQFTALDVTGLIPAILGAIVLSIVSWGIDTLAVSLGLTNGGR